MIAALFVCPTGPYVARAGVDAWTEARDARTYAGTCAVVAHPPCSRWCALARVNEKRRGARVGDDGGCFAAALAALMRCGGVLEHPASSLAWAHFGIPRPRGVGWHADGDGVWVCEVWQSAYGHLARKKTWLLYYSPRGRAPAELRWDRPRGTHQIGHDAKHRRPLPRIPDGLAHLTPPAFADALIGLAENV